MNRRGFLKVLAGGAAASVAGVKVLRDMVADINPVFVDPAEPDPQWTTVTYGKPFVVNEDGTRRDLTPLERRMADEIGKDMRERFEAAMFASMT